MTALASRVSRSLSPLRGLGLLLLLGGVALPTPARASLPELFGMGGRTSAMAGTGAAYASGFDAVYGNPAGLWQSGRQLSVGTVYGDYRLSLGTAEDGSRLDYPIDSTAGLLFGGAFTLPLGGVLRDRFQAIGAGAGMPYLGYQVIFALAFAYFLLGTVLVRRVKGVR